MKKFKAVILIIVLMFSLATTAYALVENTNDEISNEVVNKEFPEIMELRLDGAIQYALEHNRDLKMQDINIEKIKLTYDKQMKDIRQMNNIPDEFIKEIPVFERKLMELDVPKRSAELTMDIAEWNKEIKINEIKYNVEKGYFDFLQAQKELDIAKEGLALAKNQYEQSKLMYDLGTISQQQLLAIELGVSQAQVGVDGASMAYELQKMNFNNTLGLPLDQKVVLTDDIEYKEHEEINIDEAVETTIGSSAILNVSQENYELTKLTFDVVKAVNSDITYTYRENEANVELAAKNLETTQNGIEMGVRSAYLSLTTSEKQIATYELAVQQTEKALELAQISFELGQNTATEVNQAMIELMTAKKNLSKQIHAYNLALLDFKYSIGLGKTQIPAGY